MYYRHDMIEMKLNAKEVKGKKRMKLVCPIPTPFTLQPRIVATLGPPDKVAYVFTSYSSFDMKSFICFLSVFKSVFMKDTTPSTATCLAFSQVYSLLCHTVLMGIKIVNCLLCFQ